MSSSSLPAVVLVDSLTKVTPQWSPTPAPTALTGWRGETVSFQVAWLPAATAVFAPPHTLRVEVSADPRPRFHAVDLVPVQVPCWPEHGEGWLTDTAGLLPDVLRPVEADDQGRVALTATHVGWHSLWVDITLPVDDVRVRVWADEELLLDQRLPVHTVARELPPHGSQFTQWFHADSLATYYDVETWSEEHWRIISAQMHSAREMGVTMLLTPVWTPPVDTAMGAKRRLTQLLDIRRDDGQYSFGAHRLDRWLEALADAGITQVELPHLFTQWGAGFAPRFRVVVDGQATDLFGWHTPATDAEYQRFLAALIPFLRDYFVARIGLERTVFHISDEPGPQHLASYRQARASVAPLLQGCRVLDALSDPQFMELVDVPVVATDAVPAFRAHGQEPAWVYHCIAQSWGVANRFIAQEPVRTRALGWQLYKARAEGFLHWAFNFYALQLSRGPVDPFRETSAGGGFISGDSFIVYPGPDGLPWPSLRHRLVRDAFDDLAAARAAEHVLGREQVLRLIDPNDDLDYASGWVDGAQWAERRRRLDDAVRAAVGLAG